MNEDKENPAKPWPDVRSAYFRGGRFRYLLNTILAIALLTGLYFMSRLNYPLFHSFADMIVVFIAASVFIIIWSGRHVLDNQYYLFIGIAFLFFALFNFLHLLGNKGMGVFPDFGNLGPTFYIISRYLLSLSFMIAPLFIRRKINITLMFTLFLLSSVLVLLSIFYWKNFPATYIDGSGLTSFKKYSDYLIVLLFVAAIGLLLRNRRAFDARVLRFILLSLVLFIATGLSFTLYSDPFGIMNAGGHFLQIASFYIIYLAIIDTGLVKPQNLLFHSLKQSNDEILKLNIELEKVNQDLKHNIAELERTDAALKKSEDQANSLIKYAPTAIFEIDYNIPRFISVNNTMCYMSGYTREELLSLSPTQLMDSMGGRELIERIRLQHAGVRQEDAAEYQVKVKDGSMIYVAFHISFPDDRSGIAFIIGHDVTARRIYEDQLRESEERFRALSDTSPVGVGVTSAAGIIVYTNRSFDSLLGYDHAELVGSPVIDLYWHPEEREIWLRKMQNNKTIRDVEIKLKRKDAQPIWVLINASPIAYGGAQAVMSTMQDISGRKQAEDELKRYAADLELSNKELESFAYSLSHDLRAPLRALDGFSQAVLDEYSDKLDDTGRDYLERVRGAAQNMAQITEGMLKLSQVIRCELRWETVDLSGTVSEIARGLIEKSPDIHYEVVIAPGVFARGDPSLLQIALYNLIENAWKFSAKSPDAKIEFATYMQDRTPVYFIRDNGIGFNMQYTDKLFQPFQRLHASADFPGHGIGLATVQRVIRRHGGTIWAESEQDKGTTIYFTLGGYGG